MKHVEKSRKEGEGYAEKGAGWTRGYRL